MGLVQTVGVMTAKTGSEAIVRDAMAALLAPTRDEDGCVGYLLYSAADDSNTFVTIETWRDESAVETHLQSEHVKSCVRAIGRSVVAAPTVYRLQPIDPPD